MKLSLEQELLAPVPGPHNAGEATLDFAAPEQPMITAVPNKALPASQTGTAVQLDIRHHQNKN